MDAPGPPPPGPGPVSPGRGVCPPAPALRPRGERSWRRRRAKHPQHIGCGVLFVIRLGECSELARCRALKSLLSTRQECNEPGHIAWRVEEVRSDWLQDLLHTANCSRDYRHSAS